MAKISLGRILTTFEFNLPGGVSINGDGFKTEGEDEIQEIKEEILELQPPNWFISWH
jgi:hypothetical protein